ncbi:MAG: hypothetical protein COA57_08165, partial [Flavobacteriales bacterium]
MNHYFKITSSFSSSGTISLLLFFLLASPLWGDGKGVAQECNVFYVTPGGADSGTVGTKANPADFLYALSLVSGANDKIYMASGTYNFSNPINLINNVTIEGGFDPTTWEKSNSTATNIYRDNANIEPTPSRLVAMYGNTISNFLLQDLTIRCSDAFGNSTSTYSVHLTNCSNYEIVRCKLIAGNAGNASN